MHTFLMGVAGALLVAVVFGFGQQVLDETTPQAFYTDDTVPSAEATEH